MRSGSTSRARSPRPSSATWANPSTTSSPSATTPTRRAPSSPVRRVACTGRLEILPGPRAPKRNASRCSGWCGMSSESASNESSLEGREGRSDEEDEGAVFVHAELGQEPDGRGVLAEARWGRFEVMSAGCRVGHEIHPYAVEVMEEVGIDIGDQYPKGLRTYMGKMGFNYSIIVCARAEKDCPKTFPGVGTRLVWIFDDPRGEDVPEEERLEKFREIRDEIEQKIRDWLEHPEEELAKLRTERERERRERLEAARREAHERMQRLAGRTRERQQSAGTILVPYS